MALSMLVSSEHEFKTPGESVMKTSSMALQVPAVRRSALR